MKTRANEQSKLIEFRANGKAVYIKTNMEIMGRFGTPSLIGSATFAPFDIVRDKQLSEQSPFISQPYSDTIVIKDNENFDFVPEAVIRKREQDNIIAAIKSEGRLRTMASSGTAIA